MFKNKIGVTGYTMVTISTFLFWNKRFPTFKNVKNWMLNIYYKKVKRFITIENKIWQPVSLLSWISHALGSIVLDVLNNKNIKAILLFFKSNYK